MWYAFRFRPPRRRSISRRGISSNRDEIPLHTFAFCVQDINLFQRCITPTHYYVSIQRKLELENYARNSANIVVLTMWLFELITVCCVWLVCCWWEVDQWVLVGGLSSGPVKLVSKGQLEYLTVTCPLLRASVKNRLTADCHSEPSLYPPNKHIIHVNIKFVHTILVSVDHTCSNMKIVKWKLRYNI